MSAHKFKVCPKCANSDNLMLIEIHAESGTTDYGRIFVDSRGCLVPPSEFNFSPENPIAVYIQCGECEHTWTPKAKGGALVSTDDVSEYLTPEGAPTND